MLNIFLLFPVAQQGGHVGMVTWNESFGIQDVLVESEEVECYLEIAFWQVSVPLFVFGHVCWQCRRAGGWMGWLVDGLADVCARVG